MRDAWQRTPYGTLLKWKTPKRFLASAIVQHFPEHHKIKKYVDVFCGGLSVSYTYCKHGKIKPICCDTYLPLIKFWRLVRDKPSEVIEQFQLRRQGLKAEDVGLFNRLLNRLNETGNPHDLFFISRHCKSYISLVNHKAKAQLDEHKIYRLNTSRINGEVWDWHNCLRKHEFRFDCNHWCHIYEDAFYFFYPPSYVSWKLLKIHLEDLDADGFKYAVFTKRKLPVQLHQQKIEIKLYPAHESVEGFLYLNYKG